jgi:tagaturonate reductase
LDKDPLLAVGEPFALWAIGTHGAPFIDHPLVRLVDDVRPYALRKVRILNGAHTAMVIRTRGTGIETVREAVLDPEIRPWLERLLLDEILPTVDGRIVDGEAFVRQTLERFENPFIEHRFSSIELHHAAKVAVRLVPTRDEYIASFGKEPPILSELLAS